MPKKKREWTPEQRRKQSELATQRLNERKARGEAVGIAWEPSKIDQIWKGVNKRQQIVIAQQTLEIIQRYLTM
jgi:hypothetical protein